MRFLTAVIVLLCAGCASYVTPGGPAHLADISGSDTSGTVSRQPSPHFPAGIAVVRVQASPYKSRTVQGYGGGKFSVVTEQELLAEDQLQALSKWTAVDSVTMLSRSLLPARFDSLDDLRLAAAKLQADILLIYTVDTAFQAQGKAIAPSSSVSTGKAPEGASITSVASVVFTDVRTGFTYGSAEATARAGDLSKAWDSGDTVDKVRLETEHQAMKLLLADAEKTWAGIAQRYQ